MSGLGFEPYACYTNILQFYWSLYVWLQILFVENVCAKGTVKAAATSSSLVPDNVVY